MPQDEKIILESDIALRTALLNRDQANLEANKFLLSEETAWHAQASIDAKRFDLELDRLAFNAKFASL